MAVSWTLLERLSMDFLGVPSTSAALPFDTYTLFVHVLPAFLSFYVVAVLVTLPGTRTLRIALLPLIVFLAFHAAIFVDFSCGNPQRAYLNAGFGVCLCSILPSLRSDGRLVSRVWNWHPIPCLSWNCVVCHVLRCHAHA